MMPLSRLPIVALLTLTRLRWWLADRIRAVRGRAPSYTPPRHMRLVDGGHWFCHPCNPFVTGYFTPPERRRLSDQLQQSNGREALLSSHEISRGWLLKTWSGLVVLASDRSACEQTSCGSGDRLAVSPYPKCLSDAFVAAQRNDTNYAHFLCEIACSLLAFEDYVHMMPRLAITADFGADILRMAGFQIPIVKMPSHALIRVRNIEVFSMFPSGFMHAGLLQELRRRVTQAISDTTAGRSEEAAEIVFLNRSGRDHRQLVNVREVIALLRQRFPALKILVPGECSFLEQVRSMARARVVIAPQGAHAANLLWAPHLEQFIEISANGDGYVAAMATTLGATLRRCEGRTTLGPSSSLSPNQLLFANHIADLDSLSRILQEI